MHDDDYIDKQQRLLTTYRRVLSHLLQQAAQYGGEVFAPTMTASGIAEARGHIGRIKANLQTAGMDVENLPTDIPPTQPDVNSRATPTTRSPEVVQNITISGGVVGDIIGKQITNNYYHVIERPSDRNRLAMIEKVKLIWINDFLNRTIAPGERIALRFEERSDMVDVTLNAQFQELALPTRLLPIGTSIFEVFARMTGSLLILGLPGSGKTILLLELARELIQAAEKDVNHPIPVVFNLSSWGLKRRPLADWLVEELTLRYDLPRQVAKGWVNQDALLPLLDGLDEVNPEHRTACIQAINTYRQEHGLVPLVVCSRFADYQALKLRLRLRGAVLIKTLSQNQIDAYLNNNSDQFEEVQNALRHNPSLRKMADSPLMLRVIAEMYHEETTQLTQIVSIEERQLWELYVDRMLHRRGKEIRYTRQQTLRWLSWLARNMERHSQTIFIRATMQPSWLTSIAQQAIFFVCVWLMLGIGLGVFVSQSPMSKLVTHSMYSTRTDNTYEYPLSDFVDGKVIYPDTVGASFIMSIISSFVWGLSLTVENITI